MKLKHHTFQDQYSYEVCYYKASFPTILAYVITSHKSQAATIASNALVDILNVFSLKINIRNDVQSYILTKPKDQT